ncbi:MAG: C25 family cysteine peptidase [Sphingobacteriales bacterium JAD_PAG50586_3]|nr:MAG: C25 family cysteine peptidase [Sphingobacteriales bacterium JAD_PAG50586_3]
MKKFYHLVFLLLLTLSAAAQPYGNEWINYSQQYYKFPITKAGVYRIDSTALAQAGINTFGLNPANFQVFGRSQELKVFVNGEVDGNFNTGDYIEFYAEGNDGWLDSLIYAPGQKQANPYWSLFTDTAYYYLSWNTTGGNQRMNSIAWQAGNGLPVTSYFIREFVDIRDNPPALSTRRYRFGELDAVGGSDPEYVTGECWAGARITANNGVVSIPAMQSANAANGTGINAEYEARFVSVNNNPASSPNHRYKLKFANSPEKDTSFTGYQQVTLKISVPTTSLGGTTSQATWTYLNVPPATAAQSSLVYQKLRYPHTYNLENAVGYTMYVPDNANNASAQINITNFNNSASAPIVYDITNGNRIAPSVTGAAFSIIAPNGNPGLNKFFVTSNARVTYINGSQIKPVNTDPFRYAQFVNYESEVVNHDFVIVTHKSLMASANQYKTYKNLRGFNAGVIDIDDLYDQFAAGVKKDPLSMRRFAEYALDKWTVKPKYLFIIGKSVEPTFWRIGNDPPEFDSYNQNLVPSFGYPPSDVAITARTNGSGMAPALITGRLSTPNNTEAGWYLDKVIQYESNNPAAWMKNVAHFAGGTTQQEVDQFLNYLNNYGNLLTDTLFGGTINLFTKATSDPIDQSLGDSVRSLVNDGISIMNFFGHASGNGFDISLDEPSTYDNAGKYPLMIGNSCFAGDIHQPRGYSNSASESWISIQNKGAIAFLASITLGIPPI